MVGQFTDDYKRLMTSDERAASGGELSKVYSDLLLAKQRDNPAGQPSLLDSITKPKPDKAPSGKALDRWEEQINSMMLSGNPQLQKQAMSMMSAYQQRATAIPTAPTDNRTTDIKNYQFAQKQGYEGTFQDWKQSNKAKMFEDKRVGHNDRFQDAEGNEVPVPAGTTLAEVEKQGLYPYKPVSGDVGGRVAMLNTAKQQFPIIDSNLYLDNGDFDNEVVLAMDGIAMLPFGSGNFLAGQLKPKAQKVYAAFETGMQAITRTETGAAMAAEEIDNTKKRFMPRSSDTDEVKKQKIDAFKYFINNATEMLDPSISANKGLTPAQIADKAVNKALNAVKQSNAGPHQPGDTWSQQGFEYRMNEDGTVDRRAM